MLTLLFVSWALQHVRICVLIPSELMNAPCENINPFGWQVDDFLKLVVFVLYSFDDGVCFLTNAGNLLLISRWLVVLALFLVNYLGVEKILLNPDLLSLQQIDCLPYLGHFLLVLLPQAPLLFLVHSQYLLYLLLLLLDFQLLLSIQNTELLLLSLVELPLYLLF